MKKQKTHAMPALLSLIIPGLGQMMKGETGKGIGLLIMVPIGYLMFIIPGIILHLWNVCDAYNN